MVEVEAQPRRIAARHQGGPRRAAERRRVEAGEPCALAGHPVDVRGADVGMSVHSQVPQPWSSAKSTMKLGLSGGAATPSETWTRSGRTASRSIGILERMQPSSPPSSDGSLDPFSLRASPVPPHAYHGASMIAADETFDGASLSDRDSARRPASACTMWTREAASRSSCCTGSPRGATSIATSSRPWRRTSG